MITGSDLSFVVMYVKNPPQIKLTHVLISYPSRFSIAHVLHTVQMHTNLGIDGGVAITILGQDGWDGKLRRDEI